MLDSVLTRDTPARLIALEIGTGSGALALCAAPWGPVLRSGRAWLLSRGPADGDEWEELVVIRARRP